MVRNHDIRKIDLVELLHAVGLLDRPHLDAGALHVEEEHGQALVLWHIGIGTGDQEAVVGIMRARGPDLLAVDDPVVALLLRAGAQARDVGAAGRLRKQLAPDLLAGGKLRQIMAFVLLAAERHHGRTAHALADLERLRQLAVDALFLLPDHLFDRGGAAAAIFLRPVQAGPAAFGLLLLPGLADVDDLFLLQPKAAERGRGQLRLILLRRVGVDPLSGGGAEFGFLRGVIEIHLASPICSVPRTLRSAKRCAADPGSINVFVWWVPALRSSARALHRVRDTNVIYPWSVSC